MITKLTFAMFLLKLSTLSAAIFLFVSLVLSLLFVFLPTSQPSEDARLARRQRIVPREGCCMQKNSRSTYEKCKCKV